MKKYLYLGLAGLVLLLIGFAFGKYNTKPEIKEVVKEVEVEKKSVETIIKEIIKKNGTKETVTTIKDNSVTSTKKEVSKEANPSKPQWKAQALYGLVDKKTVYGLGIERRILGPISAGAFGLTNSTYGISLSLEF